MSDLIGQTLGAYQITAELGRGGMAIVYRAVQPAVKREVAIKVLPAHFLQDPSFLARFNREAEVIARLQHPRILPIYDFGDHEGLPYLVMAYMPSGTLGDMIAQAPGGLPIEEVARLTTQMAEGLDYAHRQGVIHRDFKPSNVLLDNEGNVHLADFGIVKVTADTGHLTGSGIVGTPQYMAPEMSNPDGLSPLVDVYALGVTLYQMLTGKHPYEAPTPMGVLLAHANKPIPDARELRPDLPDGAQTVIEKAMAKHPTERYQSAGQLGKSFTAAALEAPTERPETVAMRPSARPKSDPHVAGRTILAGGRRNWLIGGLAVVALAGISGLIVWLTGGGLTAAAPTVEANPQGEGGRIAFTSGVTGSGVPQHNIYTMGADGSNRTQLTGLGVESAWIRSPAWSPDGQRIAFARNFRSNFNVEIMDADGSNLTSLTDDLGTDIEPAWSPDGKQIAFVSNHDGNNELYVIDTDGSNQTRLTNSREEESYPAWSPDGNHIAFACYRDGNWEICLMNADGSAQTRLTYNPAQDWAPAWSPDGKRIAFYSRFGSNGEIYAINVDGSGQVNLTNNPADDANPTWSPDGLAIAFDSNRDGNREIYVMNADGSDPTRLTDDPADDEDPAWSPVP